MDVDVSMKRQLQPMHRRSDRCKLRSGELRRSMVDSEHVGSLAIEAGLKKIAVVMALYELSKMAIEHMFKGRPNTLVADLAQVRLGGVCLDLSNGA